MLPTASAAEEEMVAAEFQSTSGQKDVQANSDSQVMATAGKAEEDEEEGNNWATLRPLLVRYAPILVITWILHLGLGLSISITGPTLPYLALQTGQSLGSVSFLYTVRSIVVCVSSVGVGLLLGRLSSSRSKLTLLLVGSLLGAAYAVLTPFAESAAMLIFAQCLFGIGAGMVDTVDNMLVIYLFGPVLSRSFSHSLHFCIGIGGFLAPVLARPFLEQMGDIVGADSNVCSGGDENVGGINGTHVKTLDPLKWPYAIVGSLHAIWIIGYVVLLLINFQLVKFTPPGLKKDDEATRDSANDQADGDQKTQSSEDMLVTVGRSHILSRKRKAVIIVLFVIFYILHVGQENTFWSHLYSFGVCSKQLNMSASDASTLSTVFFLGFLVSRGIGIVIARLLRPALILAIQLTGCLVVTVVLAVWGETDKTVAYAFCALYGFFIAMVFPTGITWLASKMEVTGSLSSSWFIGAYIGNSTYPLAAGQLIASSPAGAISMMYLAAVTSAAYLIILVAMFVIAR